MILACHCEGRGWKCWGDSNLKSKFWGRSIQVDPVGTITLQFDDGEVFQWSKVFCNCDPLWPPSMFLMEDNHVITKCWWHFLDMDWSYSKPNIWCLLFFHNFEAWLCMWQVTTSINNLILGKLYVDHYGTMRIQGNQELSCRLKFKEQSIVDRTPHQVLKIKMLISALPPCWLCSQSFCILTILCSGAKPRADTNSCVFKLLLVMAVHHCCYSWWRWWSNALWVTNLLKVMTCSLSCYGQSVVVEIYL